MKEDFKKILIIRLSGAGDVICTLPLLCALRKAYPSSYIAWLVSKKNKDIILGHPLLDEVFIFERDRWLTAVWGLIARLRGKKFDLVIDPQSQIRSGLISYFTGAPCRLGFVKGVSREPNHIFMTKKVAPAPEHVHNVERDLVFARALGINVEKIEFLPYIGEEDTAYARDFLKSKNVSKDTPLIGLIIAGSQASRKWPEKNWAELIDKLASPAKANVIILWGPGEEESAERIKNLAKADSIIAPRTSLKQLAAFLKECELVVSNNSGPMHLAVAVGTRVIGLYGTTKYTPERTGAYGKGNIVLKADLDKVDCPKTGCKTCELDDCLRTITPSAVFSAIESVLSSNSSNTDK